MQMPQPSRRWPRSINSYPVSSAAGPGGTVGSAAALAINLKNSRINPRHIDEYLTLQP